MNTPNIYHQFQVIFLFSTKFLFFGYMDSVNTKIKHPLRNLGISDCFRGSQTVRLTYFYNGGL